MSTPTQSLLVPLNDDHGLRPTLDELCHNARLLSRLRWVAGVGILSGTAFARAALGVRLQVLPLVIIGLVVLAYNAAIYRVCTRDKRTLEQAWRIAWGQILLDWLAILALVHYTGGITSPALIYFVIHAALSGTVLLPWHARTLALLATVLIGGLALLERAGIVGHVSLPSLGLGDALYRNGTYITATVFFFGTTAFTLATLVAWKAQRLRQRERHIQQLFDARSTFLRVATHELRAPLAAGLSLMLSIEQGYAGELTETQAEIMGRVKARLEGLQVLVDDLLTLAATREAATAHAPLAPVSVREALENVIEREQPTAQTHNIELCSRLATNYDCVLAGDIGLSIIFGNLLNNAIKYTPSGGRVCVRYSPNPDAHMAEITITDTGIGIPKGDLPHIFDEFYRAQNARAMRVTGSGIGLATVRTLVERYHGTLDLDSVEGEGTRICVALPLAGASNGHSSGEPI